MKRMKTAVCQMEIIWEDKAANLEKASGFVRAAALHQADIILFPEMSMTGFSMNTEATAEESFGESVCNMQQLARKNRIAIGFGWVKKGLQKAQNHYTVIGADGEICSDYAKIHPFGFAGEDQYFEGGNEVVLFETAGQTCSNFICYDLRFPEIFQAVADKADIIFVPANWPERRREHWNTLLKARAIENQVYIVGINCYGYQEGQYYSGDSQVITPLGEVLECLSDKEGMFFCEIPDDADKLRAGFPVRKDRKPGLYAKLLQGIEKERDREK